MLFQDLQAVLMDQSGYIHLDVLRGKMSKKCTRAQSLNNAPNYRHKKTGKQFFPSVSTLAIRSHLNRFTQGYTFTDQ